MTRPLAEVVARTNARGVAQRNGSLILLALDATVSTDFHTLTSDQLDKLDPQVDKPATTCERLSMLLNRYPVTDQLGPVTLITVSPPCRSHA